MRGDTFALQNKFIDEISIGKTIKWSSFSFFPTLGCSLGMRKDRTFVILEHEEY